MLSPLVGIFPVYTLDSLAKVVETMEQTGAKLDLVGYNSMINGFVRSGDLMSAGQWFQKLIQADLTPDSYSFAPIVNAYVRRMQKDPRALADVDVWLI